MAAKKQIPVQEGLFTWPSDQPALIGSKCKSCEEYFFPKVKMCQNPECSKRDVEEVLFSRRGTLWTFSTQHYPPPPPYRGPVPFIVGLMALSKENLKIMGRLTDDTKEEDLKIGTDLELVVEKLYEDDDGNDVVTWKFKPV